MIVGQTLFRDDGVDEVREIVGAHAEFLHPRDDVIRIRVESAGFEEVELSVELDVPVVRRNHIHQTLSAPENFVDVVTLQMFGPCLYRRITPDKECRTFDPTRRVA
jgi:hypothetical protein